MTYPTTTTDSLNLLMTALLRHFSQYIDLSGNLKNEIINRGKQQFFKKGELIHDGSKICTHSYFIQQGLLRLYFLKNDKEVSEYFCSEGEWVNSPRSFRQRQPEFLLH